MDALLDVLAWDSRDGNASDHYFRTFESRRTIHSAALLKDARA